MKLPAVRVSLFIAFMAFFVFLAWKFGIVAP